MLYTMFFSCKPTLATFLTKAKNNKNRLYATLYALFCKKNVHIF